ncbi:MAG: hypothetical protein HY028_01160 [Gammaproteobacteria bacterium]|nr:hypothetical protein [Gammaproteobacteria bacterium]
MATIQRLISHKSATGAWVKDDGQVGADQQDEDDTLTVRLVMVDGQQDHQRMLQQFHRRDARSFQHSNNFREQQRNRQPLSTNPKVPNFSDGVVPRLDRGKEIFKVSRIARDRCGSHLTAP